MRLNEAKKILNKAGYLVEKEEGNYYSVTICYTDTNGEMATKTKIEFTDNDKLAESKALDWFKKKFEYETIRWIDSKELKFNESEKVLNDAGFLMESRLATFDGVVREIKKLLKSKYEVTDKNKFNQYVEELTPVRVPQVYTSAEYARKLCKDYFGW